MDKYMYRGCIRIRRMHAANSTYGTRKSHHDLTNFLSCMSCHSQDIYKSVVLVTLGVCHLLNGLVVVYVEARKKLVRCSGEELCEGHCACPAGAAKSNSS